MNNQEIVDNAPEGATHVDFEGDYFKVETVYQYEDESDCGYEDMFRFNYLGDWIVDRDNLRLTRSLADIKRIAELEKERDEREKSLKKLLYCCDGLSTEYAQNNHGEVQEWLRHVDAAYQALKEKG